MYESRLTIRAYKVHKIYLGSKMDLTKEGELYLNPEYLSELAKDFSCIQKAELSLVTKEDKDIFIHGILDVFPLSAKVLGEIGEGVTHTLMGVSAMLTGVDEKGREVASFGSANGSVNDVLVWDRAGTPKSTDVIVLIHVLLKDKMGQEREGITQAHLLADVFFQEIRNRMRHLKGVDALESHTYVQKERPGKKKILLIKQVAGQGAMYDTHLFGKEPSGAIDSRSMIDFGNMPVVISPNEYRDGILRSMH